MSLSSSVGASKSAALRSREIARIGLEFSAEFAEFIGENWEEVISSVSTISLASVEIAQGIQTSFSDVKNLGSADLKTVMAAIVILRSLAEKVGVYSDVHADAQKRSKVEFENTDFSGMSDNKRKMTMTLIYAKNLSECLQEQRVVPDLGS